MKKKFLFACFVSFILAANTSSAQTSSQIDEANKDQTNIVLSSADASEVIIDKEVPSAFQFLIAHCELKDGSYYLPQKKFIELTEQQQYYLRNNKTKFIIQE